MQSVFFEHSGIKLKSIIESPNMWKLNNMLLNNPWAKKEISRAITKYIELS